MSAMLTMVPSSATKATDSGSRVFFIQKHCCVGCSKTNSMPSCCGISLRCIRPVVRCSVRWRDLGVDLVHAGGQRHARQVHLRLLGADGQRRGARPAARAIRLFSSGIVARNENARARRAFKLECLQRGAASSPRGSPRLLATSCRKPSVGGLLGVGLLVALLSAAAFFLASAAAFFSVFGVRPWLPAWRQPSGRRRARRRKPWTWRTARRPGSARSLFMGSPFRFKAIISPPRKPEGSSVTGPDARRLTGPCANEKCPPRRAFFERARRITSWLLPSWRRPWLHFVLLGFSGGSLLGFSGFGLLLSLGAALASAFFSALAAGLASASSQPWLRPSRRPWRRRRRRAWRRERQRRRAPAVAAANDGGGEEGGDQGGEELVHVISLRIDLF